MPESTTSLAISQNACILAGIDPIVSFSDGTRESQVCNAIYEDTVLAALMQYHWRFAVKQATLVREGAATARWDSAYTYPADALKLIAVTVNDTRIEYDVYGEDILCNAGASDTVIADYIWRQTEDKWPAHFTMYVELRLATLLAISVARDNGLMQMLDQQAGRQLITARHVDSHQQTTRKLTTSRFIAERRT